MNIFQAEMIVFHPCYFYGDMHLPSAGSKFLVAWATVFQATPSTHLFLIWPKRIPESFETSVLQAEVG
jgi:hypothetical protein